MLDKNQKSTITVLGQLAFVSREITKSLKKKAYEPRKTKKSSTIQDRSRS